MDRERAVGRVCLSFAATLAERGSTDLEHLGAPTDLADWLVRAAVLSHRPDVAESDLGTAHQLREAVYQTLTATIDGRAVSREDRGVLNAAARVAPPVPALAADGNIERGGTVTAGLSALARDCLELLTGPEGDLLRRCAGAACTRIFLDPRQHTTLV